MAVAIGYLDCAAPSTNYVAFSSAQQTLTADGEKNHTLSVCLADEAGNHTKYEVPFRVDLTPPSGFIQINNGAVYTTTNEVLVNLTASPDVDRIKLAPVGSYNCADSTGYQAMSLTSAYTLAGADGESNGWLH